MTRRHEMQGRTQCQSLCIANPQVMGSVLQKKRNVIISVVAVISAAKKKHSYQALVPGAQRKLRQDLKVLMMLNPGPLVRPT